MTSHGRLNFLSSVTNLSIRASIPANKANGNNCRMCVDGPSASDQQEGVKITARIREVKRSPTHTPLLSALSYIILDVVLHLKALASLLAPVSHKKK